MKTEHCDICVIGSGAGGGMVACRAARAGKRVIVLEQGPYVRAPEMNDRELEMIPRLYKDGGLQMNTSMDMFILQGSCVGGSTVLSNMVMMRAAAGVFDSWRAFGAPVGDEMMSEAYGRIDAELGARHVDPANVARSTDRFLLGASKIGLETRSLPKALGDGCRGCGNCNLGCMFDTKKSALKTYIPWAEQAGARVLPNTEVLRVERRRGRVTGVIARDVRGTERTRVVARQVVIAAGAIGSSAVLLRSGVRKNVGTRLSFNAGSMLVGDFEDAVDGFDGDQMTSCVHGDGFLIEPTHNPIMSAALTMPGYFEKHGDLMRRYRHTACAGALVQTGPTGRVVHSPFWGHEETRFQAGDDELRRLRRGLRAIGEVYFAAGARRVILPTYAYREITSRHDLGQIDEAIRSTRQVTFGTAHPQGGNPMSDDPDVGVVNRHFQVHGTEGLFVCDASVFPSGVGVNPVNTILALADVGAQRILSQA